MNGLSFLLTDLEISFEDALPACGLGWLVGRCVCGIPYYFLAHTSHTFSPHTLTGHHCFPLLLFAVSLAAAHMRTHPGPDAKTSAAPCQWSKYFQRGARSGQKETQLGSCVDCQRTNGSQTHPYGCPVSQPRRRLKGHEGPRRRCGA